MNELDEILNKKGFDSKGFGEKRESSAAKLDDLLADFGISSEPVTIPEPLQPELVKPEPAVIPEPAIISKPELVKPEPVPSPKPLQPELRTVPIPEPLKPEPQTVPKSDSVKPEPEPAIISKPLPSEPEPIKTEPVKIADSAVVKLDSTKSDAELATQTVANPEDIQKQLKKLVNINTALAIVSGIAILVALLALLNII